MKDYNKNEEESFLQYVDANNFYGWAMSQKLPLNGSKWVKNFEDFIKNYDEDGDIVYFLEVDIQYPRKLYDLHSDLPFLPERMETNRCNKLVCNLYDKKLCCP